MPTNTDTTISYTTEGKFAIVTLNNPKQLNALTLTQWYRLATVLDEIDERAEILVTVLTGKGRFFCAGANIIQSSTLAPDTDMHQYHLQNSVAILMHLSNAFSKHSKILVAAMNGPAIGGGAAVAAFADLTYAAPHTYIHTPFASLGLVTEVGTSYTLVRKLGLSLANEVMLTGRKLSAAELLQAGFVNKIFCTGPTEDERFHELVMKDLKDKFGDDRLNAQAVLGIRALIRRPDRDIVALQIHAEAFAGWERQTSGEVAEQMRKLGIGQQKHKL